MKERLLLIFLMGICAFPFSNLQAQDEYSEAGAVQASKVEFLGTTPPLRDLIVLPPTDLEKRKKLKSNKPKVVPNFQGRGTWPEKKKGALPLEGDPIRQKNIEKNTGIIVEPTVNIAGLNSSNSGSIPPDPAGDIGQNYYCQMVNSTVFRFFNKDGQAVTPPMGANTLWSSLGFSSLGDPIILYDQGAERWFLTEFAVQGNNILAAVSQTSDPMGSWHVYNFTTPQFPDYPKYGIWHNAYVITSNEGAVPFYVLQRDSMLVGSDDVNMQRFTIPSIGGGPSFQVATPVDWDGDLAPPTDANPMIMRIADDDWGAIPADRLEIYSIDIDWDNPQNSSFSNQNLLTEPFDSDGCASNGPGFSCIPQPSGPDIDGIPAVIMNRVQYRNFGDYETMVLNFLVNAGSTFNVIGGIRWVELRRTVGENAWSIYQEGTFAPDDGHHRFMGGIAMDGAGNIGLAYNVSSPTLNPSLRFTGRRSSDPLGEMTVEEFEFGTGMNTNNSIRYGDYSAMCVDPSDDRTFWYTGEYNPAGITWGTRIVAFKVTRDTVDMGPLAMLTPETSPNLGDAEVVKADFKNFGLDTQNVFTVGYLINDDLVFTEVLDTLLLPDSTYSHTFTQPADLSEIGIYDFKIFTDLEGDSQVLNDTLRVTIEKLSRDDAGVTAINGLEELLCGEETSLEFELTNFGFDTLFSASMHYQFNDGPIEVLEWTGALLMDESELISINATGYQNGINTITAYTSLPNGVMDEFVENDTLNRTFSAILNGTSVFLSLKFDLNPSETSWILVDSEGTTLYNGGPYPDQPPVTIIEEEFCLDPDSCYTFTIFDSMGDGIGLIDGSYTLINEEGQLLASLMDPDFGVLESNDFCATYVCVLEAVADIINETEPGTNDGAIVITASNGVGDLLYSIDGGENFQEDNIFIDLPAGTYEIVVQDGNGCIVELETIIGLETSVEDAELEYKIQVFPNPTDGLFRINIEGLQNTPFLNLELIDLTGKVVLRQKLQQYNGVLTGAMSLLAFPSGAYFVRLRDERISNLIKIIKE